MTYNEQVDNRVRQIIYSWKEIDSKTMFGGVCHLLRGNMFCGVYKDYLILRLGEKGAAEALKAEHTRPFDITGKPMKGWVMVEQKGFKSDDELEAFLEEAKGFVETMPAK